MEIPGQLPMVEELPAIGSGASNPLKINGFEVYSSDEVFKVPQEIVTSLEKATPLSALREVVAACLHVKGDDVSFVYEGRELDMEKTMKDNNVVEPGAMARKRGQKIELRIALASEPGALLRLQKEEEAEAEKRLQIEKERKQREEEEQQRREEIMKRQKQEEENIWSVMMRMEDETTTLDQALWDLGIKDIALDVLRRKFATWAEVGFDSYESMYNSVVEGVAVYVHGKGRRGAIVRGVNKVTADDICKEFQPYRLPCTSEMDEPGGEAATRVRKCGKGNHWNPPIPREEAVVAREKLAINVKRQQVLSTAIPQVLKADPHQLWPDAVKVHYEDEDGEGRGVNREFVSNVCSRLVAPEFCLMLPAVHNRLMLNSMLDTCRKAGLQKCGADSDDDLTNFSTEDLLRFFGRMIGMAFMFNAPLGAFFIPSLYKQLLGDRPAFADLRYVPCLADDSETGWYFSMFNLVAQRVDDAFLGLEAGKGDFLQRTASSKIDSICLTCEIPSAPEQVLESLATVFGKPKDALREELGKNLAVDERNLLAQTLSAIDGEGMESTEEGPAELTSQNISNFVHAVVQKVLTDNLRPHIDLIIEEFRAVVPTEKLESLTWAQLETNLGGRLMTADRIQEWKDRTVLKDYESSAEILKWWWEYVQECCEGDGRRVKNLFSWCTGFNGAMPISWRFQIWNTADTSRHPAINTCLTHSTGAGNTGDPMPTLYLPPYTSKEEFIEKLQVAQLVKSFDKV